MLDRESDCRVVRLGALKWMWVVVLGPFLIELLPLAGDCHRQDLEEGSAEASATVYVVFDSARCACVFKGGLGQKGWVYWWGAWCETRAGGEGVGLRESRTPRSECDLAA